MESSAFTPSEPLTLPVSNLTESTSFYLTALAPLGYGFVSKVQHQTPTGRSEAVGLGPRGSSRVDVFLSQSYRLGAQVQDGVHVVFPALSRIAVREFYAAALQAGGKPVARPDYLSTSDGMFASIITDVDGNQVEVCFGDSLPPADKSPNDAVVPNDADPPADESIDQWRESVAGSAAPESIAPKSVATSTTTKPTKSKAEADVSRSTMPAKTTAGTLKSVITAAASSRASARRSTSTPEQSSDQKREQKGSIFPTSSVNVGGKTVVGTLIGAAAGAALAYGMVRSKQDSQEQEEEHKYRMRADEAKAEARAHRDWANRTQASGKVELTDRDSGYSSGSYREPTPSMLKHRSVTYPQPSSDGTSRGRSISKKLLEYGQRATSPESYKAPSRRQSVGASSRSTVKPVRRSHSSATSSRESRSSRRPPSPPRLPAPPPMPAAPATRSRRNSATPPTSPGVSRRSTISAKDKPPSSFSRAMGTDAHRSEAPKLERAPSSRHSNRSARNTPLPSSDAQSRSTIKAPNSHHSNRTARMIPLPASEAPTALTARALSKQNKAQAPEIGSKLDDLGTVVPDDSISCASEREERRDRESRASRRSQRPSSRISRHESVSLR